MSSYKKYIMMGASTILIPLLKNVLFKIFSRYAEEQTKYDSSAKATD
ncbi:MAG: hypothetical protein HQK79_17685 [Desulfobacterales bacterium]|nr:hypothetical protein [Desulfobacterales bacterium]MBF0398899.1 hypothetical protein [Desulfobacterales bacterium]